MFYQNNNDYMRDAFFYSTPQNSTYPNGYMNTFTPMNNMQTGIAQNPAIPVTTMGNNMVTNLNNLPMMNNTMVNPIMNSQMNTGIMPQQCMQGNDISRMYPQVYKIINPVACRVISNSNCQCITEDSLNNMVDTVYNIVEGDVSTLTNTISSSGDDTITQGAATRGTTSNTNITTTSNSGARQTNISSESTRTMRATTQNNSGENCLLRDLIKIIIITELLARQRNFGTGNSCMTQMNNSGFTNNSNNFCNYRMYGVM